MQLKQKMGKLVGMKCLMCLVIMIVLVGCFSQNFILLQKSHTGAMEEKKFGVFSINYGAIVDEGNYKRFKDAENKIPEMIRRKYSFKFVVPISTENTSKSLFVKKDYQINDRWLTFQIPSPEMIDSFSLNYGLVIKGLVISNEQVKSIAPLFAPSEFIYSSISNEATPYKMKEKKYAYADYILWNYETDSPVSFGMIKIKVDEGFSELIILDKIMQKIFDDSPFKPKEKESSIFEIKSN